MHVLEESSTLGCRMYGVNKRDDVAPTHFQLSNEDVSAIKICRDENADQSISLIAAKNECIMFPLIFEFIQFTDAGTFEVAVLGLEWPTSIQCKKLKKR